MDAVLHKWIVYISLILTYAVAPTFAGDYCYMYSYGYYNLYLAYCSSSCCGSYAYYRYCCYSSYYYYYYSAYWSVGAIVGAVIGGIIGLVVLVVFVAIICQQCNKRTRRGAVIGPSQTVTTISSNQTVVGYSAQQQPYQPQPYGVPPPQSYGVPPPQPQPGPVYGTDPAYPPTNAMFPPGPPQYTPQTAPPPYK